MLIQEVHFTNTTCTYVVIYIYIYIYIYMTFIECMVFYRYRQLPKYEKTTEINTRA